MAKNLAYTDFDELEDQMDFEPIKKKPTDLTKQPKKKKGHHSHEIVEFPDEDV